jgi:hypothetical protein
MQQNQMGVHYSLCAKNVLSHHANKAQSDSIDLQTRMLPD